ncbi:hypothetical protein OG337_28995 [[Kitasatospora] papulosa]|uniref:hypothetical protein n=1 Tax=[Kitasatospora] papulosa TaxID=1464011 RepID=UPI0038699B90|nr:hypothetical protein OG337_28995 [[Kitasatospora] papulosa]
MTLTTQHQETTVNPEAMPHPYIVTTIPNGQDIDWTHPENCPLGDDCDIARRTRRMGIDDMAALAEGRPDGTYRLGRYHFHGLVLIDENGRILPDVEPAPVAE